MNNARRPPIPTEVTVTKTNLQSRAAALHAFVRDRVAAHDESHIHATLALGVRLLTIMREARSEEFQAQVATYHDRAMAFFRTSDDGYGLVRSVELGQEARSRANIFEREKHGKQANFCRCIACICTALERPSISAALPISQAAVNALHAGADEEKIKQAVMLLF